MSLKDDPDTFMLYLDFSYSKAESRLDKKLPVSQRQIKSLLGTSGDKAIFAIKY